MVERATTTSGVGVAVPWLALPTFWRATIGGILGTFAMTASVYLTQSFGVSQLEVARTLGIVFGESNALIAGTALHVLIGIVLALIYAYGFQMLLPGPSWVRGLIYALLPTTFIVILIPLMAWGLLIAGVMAFGPVGAAMWLVNQLVYGLVLGLFFGTE